MSITIQISAKALKAASRASAKQDIRYYLNSVYVEASTTETICVATDGHHMLAVRREAENQTEETVSVIIPTQIVKLVTQGLTRHDPHVLDFILDGDKWTAPLAGCGRLQFEGIVAKYPDWRAVVPRKTTGEAGNYNPKYLIDFQDAARDLGANKYFSISMFQNGLGTALITSSALDGFDFAGLIMPYKDENVAKNAPAWAITQANAKAAIEESA